jgi:NarL family two-component system response regulator LiaR
VSEQDPIRVLVVDDHFMVRYGLKTYLSVVPDMECCGEAASGVEALAICQTLKPDVVLVDLMMPDLDGADTIAEMRRICPHVRAIALTSYVDQELVQRVVRAGAMGYLLKHATMPQLTEAIRNAVQGRPTLAPEATEALMKSTVDERIDETLTTRELEVLQLMAEGKTNQEIARALNISESTARFHVGKLFAKLGVSNRTEAVRTALRLRLVT